VGSAKWQQTLRNMQQEADALEKAVEVGKDTFAFFGKVAPEVQDAPKATQSVTTADGGRLQPVKVLNLLMMKISSAKMASHY
jgi:hypothetical protein